MALTEIEYGALASSDVMNNNFRYLENQISNLSETVVSNYAGANSNIASVNNSISELQENVNSKFEEAKDDITELFSENGMYVTTYINGSSWYREYFADKEKTTRIWLEQGGYSKSFEGDSRYGNVTFIKAFPDTNYAIVVTGVSASMSNDHTPWVNKKYGEKFRFCNASGGVPINWYACGK